MGAGVGRRWKGQRGLEGGMGGGIVNAIGFDGSEVSVKQAADCFFLLNGSLRAVGRAGACFIAFPGSSPVAAPAESVANRQTLVSSIGANFCLASVDTAT